jgi:phosphoglycerate dehydrogenase-like enzyme
VDQKALTRALASGSRAPERLEQEPVDPADPLWDLPNVILSPHALAWTEEIVRDNGLEACDHILSVARGQVPDGLVNHEVLQQPAFQRKLARYREAHL